MRRTGLCEELVAPPPNLLSQRRSISKSDSNLTEDQKEFFSQELLTEMGAVENIHLDKIPKTSSVDNLKSSSGNIDFFEDKQEHHYSASHTKEKEGSWYVSSNEDCEQRKEDRD